MSSKLDLMSPFGLYNAYMEGFSVYLKILGNTMETVATNYENMVAMSQICCVRMANTLQKNVGMASDSLRKYQT